MVNKTSSRQTGLRVAALMRILAENYAVNINRAILISPALKVDVDAGKVVTEHGLGHAGRVRHGPECLQP